MNPIAVTPGEPAGIGPEILLRCVAQGLEQPIVAIANKDLLVSHAKLLQLPVDIIDWQGPATQIGAKQLAVLSLPMDGASEVGILNTENASYVLATIDRAIQGCINNEFSAMVTGPVHKAIINQAGYAFTGHTHYLADATHSNHVVMMFAWQDFRIALVTIHMPLRQVANAVTDKNLRETIHIVTDNLRTYFHIENPHLFVCGLNPHAGESGNLGREEIEIIEPCLKHLRAEGMHLTGPLPADTLFTEKYLKQADAIIAMYHDQALPVFKYASFGHGVNVTLGLPFIRTSVDHGTALNIAGQGIADPGSLRAAIDLASEMAK